METSRDGTVNALVSVTGFDEEGGDFESEWERLAIQIGHLPQHLPAGVRVRLSWRVSEKEAGRYLDIVSGLPTIRSKFWKGKRASMLFVTASETARVIDANGWTVEVVTVALRFDPYWLGKGKHARGSKPKSKKG